MWANGNRFRVVVISFLGGRDNLESAFFQETDGAEDIVFPAYGKGKQGTCRSLDASAFTLTLFFEG